MEVATSFYESASPAGIRALVMIEGIMDISKFQTILPQKPAGLC